MPKLSLYHPEKGNNYKFIDKQISRAFQYGCVDIYLHKYLGTSSTINHSADQPVYNSISEHNIQDLLLLENRDRTYEPEIYRIRGHYITQNLDFNVSQFAIFIDTDTLFLMVHITDFIRSIGRKPLSGDVLEFPNLKDDYALNDFEFGMPRYYVIEDVGRASEGYSATWYPHLYRLRLKRMNDTQQFTGILDQPVNDDTSTTIRDLLSTYNVINTINEQNIIQAETDVPLSGYETRQFYTMNKDNGLTEIITVNNSDEISINLSATTGESLNKGYSGYLVGNGFPPNGYPFGKGVQFPEGANQDDYYLRTDFLPHRLFRFDGVKWLNIEDSVRMSMTNTDSRETLLTSFINNNNFTYNDKVGTDTVKLHIGDYIINTNIDYISSLYIVVKYKTIKKEYILSEHSNMLHNNNGKVQIILPVINGTQDVVDYDGNWIITMYNYRENERQYLNKAFNIVGNL